MFYVGDILWFEDDGEIPDCNCIYCMEVFQGGRYTGCLYSCSCYYWYEDGKLQSPQSQTDPKRWLPAIVCASGVRSWYLGGQLHSFPSQTDPAATYPVREGSGTLLPATIYSDGYCEYRLHGRMVNRWGEKLLF